MIGRLKLVDFDWHMMQVVEEAGLLVQVNLLNYLSGSRSKLPLDSIYMGWWNPVLDLPVKVVCTTGRQRCTITPQVVPDIRP